MASILNPKKLDKVCQQYHYSTTFSALISCYTIHHHECKAFDIGIDNNLCGIEQWSSHVSQRQFSIHYKLALIILGTIGKKGFQVQIVRAPWFMLKHIPSLVWKMYVLSHFKIMAMFQSIFRWAHSVLTVYHAMTLMWPSTTVRIQHVKNAPTLMKYTLPFFFLIKSLITYLARHYILLWFGGP